MEMTIIYIVLIVLLLSIFLAYILSLDDCIP